MYSILLPWHSSITLEPYSQSPSAVWGRTEQPSVTQLSPVIDVSDPLNIRYGNPDLKPSFQHRFNVRYQRSNPEKASPCRLPEWSIHDE
jgi:hypothetical protein